MIEKRIKNESDVEGIAIPTYEIFFVSFLPARKKVN